MMLKRCILSVVLVAFLMSVVSTPLAFALGEEDYSAVMVAQILEKTNVTDLKSKAAILMDASTGSVLLEKNSHDKLSIASITKIMTMLLIMEALDSGSLKLEDKVQASENVYNMEGSSVYLKPGEEFTVDEMLKAIAIHSANDASVAMAEKISGSETSFVTLMNEKAKALEMNDTNFLDCEGLTDEGHYSSAYDVALMSKELISKHPGILKYTSTWHDTFRNGKFSLDNTNKLLHSYQGMNGLKTGSTTKAGFCLSATAVRNNTSLISVILGGPDTNTRFAETKKLLDYGFANFEMVTAGKKGEELGDAVVKKGSKIKIKAVLPQDINLLVNKVDKGKISKELVLNTDITAPVKEGQKLGEVIYKANGKEVARFDAVAKEKVDKANFIVLFFRMILGWFGVGK